MVYGGIGLAIIIGLLVWLASSSVLYGLIALVVVALLTGGGVYSRRW